MHSSNLNIGWNQVPFFAFLFVYYNKYQSIVITQDFKYFFLSVHFEKILQTARKQQLTIAWEKKKIIDVINKIVKCGVSAAKVLWETITKRKKKNNQFWEKGL